MIASSFFRSIFCLGVMTIITLGGIKSFAAGAESVSTEDAFYRWLLDPTAWTLHTQATTISQGNLPFHSPYAGAHSLFPQAEARTSFTSTEFIGRQLWTGAAVFFNPELIAGQGISRTLGLAGAPNGEIYRVDDPSFKLALSRLYAQQVWGFSDEKEKIASDQNQLAGSLAVDRATFVVGRFSMTDFFDGNSYAHDPRTQFINWPLFANGAWDYAADTRGYTWGVYGEYRRAAWSIRAASVLEPRQANELTLETRVGRARSDNLEGEWRYHLHDRPGILRLMSYVNHAHMGDYEDAIRQSPNAPDVTTTRDYRIKYGFGINLEQALTDHSGIFMRAGWNDGHTETWAFTEIDQTVSAGYSLGGVSWHRPDDRIGVAGVIDGLSSEHRDYLSHGGLGFIIGDGKLNYAPEQIIETYYALHVWRDVTLTTDLQGVKNPAYNADRGPVLMIGERVHLEF